MSENLLLIGAGPIAVEYSQILKKLSVPHSVVGRVI